MMRSTPRDFGLFVAGQSLSQIGDQCYLITLTWLVSQRSGSTAALGVVLALAAIPRALLMPFGGALADRLSHRRVLIGVNLLLAILLLPLIGLSSAGVDALWPYALIAVAVGALEGVLTPAAYSMVPLLVPGEVLERANAIFLGGVLISGIAGPALGGALLERSGAALAFAIDSASFLGVAGLLWLIRPTPRPAAAQRVSLAADLRATAAAVRADRVLALYIALLLLGNLAVAGPLEVGLVAMAQRVFLSGPGLLGTAMALFAGGSLAGTLLAGTLARPAWRQPLLFSGILGTGVALSAVGASPTAPLFLALVALFGGGIGAIDVLMQSSIQQRAPRAQLGRVLGVTLCAGKLLAPLSTLIAGVVAEAHAPLIFFAAGALWVTTTIVALAISRAMPAAAQA
ncbi:MFS transporter [Oscillochloris sp. ZM17-4]|uniref:MFS transporter n=1 Tax=Oscillochloris sp. ZM17-4 TaxID=2866714 RepID=UPI001C729D72|nr:MFS transporter [Oscillochloris sp. ZM17-4]MBX0330935.1 MFS transporter [Oscillochloris sp. ZM17-4]